jgi:hypothetical protein
MASDSLTNFATLLYCQFWQFLISFKKAEMLWVVMRLSAAHGNLGPKWVLREISCQLKYRGGRFPL